MLVHSRSFAVAALALVATSALSAGTLDAQQPAPPPIPQIVTSGQGESKIAPDRARIEISVQTRALTAAAAGSENARKQQAVLDALKKLGFASDQLSTVNYSLYPEMQYDKEGRTARVVGYTAMNTVRVEVRDLTLVGKAIDASLSTHRTPTRRVVRRLRWRCRARGLTPTRSRKQPEAPLASSSRSARERFGCRYR